MTNYKIKNINGFNLQLKKEKKSLNTEKNKNKYF